MDPQLIGLGDLLIGSLLAVVGLLALLLSGLRHRRGNLLLTTFGIFALLYGIRQFFSSELIGGLGVSSLASGWVTATTTYLINIPAWSFFWVLLGKRRPSLPFWYLVSVSIFAAIGILSDVIQRSPGTLSSHPNNILVLIGLVVVGIALFEHRHRMTTDLKIYMAGLTGFGIMAVNDNLVSLGWLPWQWSEESIGFVVYVGVLGYIALRRSLDNERQLASIESELETARQIQSSLLPQELPDRGLFPMALRFQPTSAVAGDLYDFLAPGPRKLGVLIADVSGHGVPAALIASMVKIAVTSKSDCADRPAELLSSVNRTLCGSLKKGFVTASYVLLDLDEGRLVCANAGHPSPLLLSKGGSVAREIGGHGPILGRFESATFEEEELVASPGDRLVLYTDGLVEARNRKDEMFGEERLKAVLERGPGVPLEKLCDAVLSDLRKWTGSGAGLALDDDLTMLTLEVARPTTGNDVGHGGPTLGAGT